MMEGGGRVKRRKVRQSTKYGTGKEERRGGGKARERKGRLSHGESEVGGRPRQTGRRGRSGRRRESREEREVNSVRENLTVVSPSVWSLGVPTEASRANSSSSGDRGPTGMCLLPRHTCRETERGLIRTPLYPVRFQEKRRVITLLHVTSIGIISVTSW